MTSAFYVPRLMITGGVATLPPEEAHHAARVIRHRPGDVVRAFDGQGTAFVIRLTHAADDDVRGEVIERLERWNEPSYDLTLAVGLLKQRARFENLVEKAVELGASRIVPLVTSRTEKGGFRGDRLEKIALAAVKQCGRSLIPEISEPLSTDAYLRAADRDVRLICHEAAPGAPSVLDALGQIQGSRISAMVGPEGGFDDEEVARAREHGFLVVRLGSRRLRGETAAITVASACMLSEIRSNDTISR